MQIKSDSSSFGSGGEDWITKKRVETKTVKSTEKRIQRQVVLEDGRVIEEDVPEVTLDTVEDIESHSDDCDDDIKQIGGGELVPVSLINRGSLSLFFSSGQKMALRALYLVNS